MLPPYPFNFATGTDRWVSQMPSPKRFGFVGVSCFGFLVFLFVGGAEFL